MWEAIVLGSVLEWDSLIAMSAGPNHSLERTADVLGVSTGDLSCRRRSALRYADKSQGDTLMLYDAPPDWLDRELVLGFFWRFSVFECALKREGFVQARQNETAQPDWNRFSKSIRGRFGDVRATGFRDALRDLKDTSPRRQVVRGGQLGWEAVEQQRGEAEEDFVLRLVRIARNNLFHGGKYPDGAIEEIARNKVILRAALAVLEGCYELHPGVARRIDDAA